MTTFRDAVELMNSLCGDGPNARFKNKNKMREFLQLSDSETKKFYHVLNGKITPRSDTLFEWMEKLGFRVIAPWESPVKKRSKKRDA